MDKRTLYLMQDALNDSESLEHHGVLGMKWGHRKAVNQIKKAEKLEKEYGSNPKKIHSIRTANKLAKAAGLRSLASDFDSNAKVSGRKMRKNARTAVKNKLKEINASNKKEKAKQKKKITNLMKQLNEENIKNKKKTNPSVVQLQANLMVKKGYDKEKAEKTASAIHAGATAASITLGMTTAEIITKLMK